MSNHEPHEKHKKEPQMNTDSHGSSKVIPSGGEVLIYRTDNGKTKVDVRLVNETLWMTQADMAQLFQCSADNISLHLKNIYEEGELIQEATTEVFSVVRKEVKRREFIENIAEDEYLRDLEQAAKQLPDNRSKGGKKDGEA